MAALAAEYHWSEEFILLELHPARGEQYWHALLRRHNWTTTAVEVFDVAEQLRGLEGPAQSQDEAVDDPELMAALARFSGQ